ncbi:MAG: hypothetical protein JWN65_1646 [Solirubrobacterales bacterium]|jgi:hypothetical protein|nr:hypothetical protein [Solirubrobacterales bacterium]
MVMRMRLSRTTDRRRLRERPRDVHVPLTPEVEAAAPVADGTDPLAQEHRMRAAGGPEDNATYTCACGLVFEAAVSTSVACPACGAAQAW